MAGSRLQVPDRYAAVYDGYAAAVAQAAHLGADTRRAYLTRVRSYLGWLASSGPGGLDPLRDPGGRNAAAREYLGYLAARGLQDATISAHLTALDHLYEHLGLGRPAGMPRGRPAGAQRGSQPARARRTLGPQEQDRFVRAVAEHRQARDRAIAYLLLRAGLRISELAALDTGDVHLGSDAAEVAVRDGAGGSRTIPVRDEAAVAALAEWAAERPGWPGAGTPALFLNARGGRLSTRAVDLVVGTLARAAGLADADGRRIASAKTLRDTFGADLLHDGADIVTVAELMGHRLDSTQQLAAAAAGP